ncbi:MAG: metallophosphoesterase family protein [bacterium]|nr:metallophosphoesterase family protein [bacterium]
MSVYTSYFRHVFSVADPGSIDGLILSVQRDDGAVAYLNGTEVFRSNMPTGTINHLSHASSAVGGSGETSFNQQGVPASFLVPGDNVLAVEIHQANATSSDISFDLDLQTGPAVPPLARAPYLHNSTTSSVVVRWRTTLPLGSHVAYGPAPGSLTSSVTNPTPTTEHEVVISGLLPGTTYYYSVGTTTETWAGDDSDHYFRTQPTPGTRPSVRVWVIGDSGECAVSAQGCTDAGNVRDAYLNFAGGNFADVWLLLGDNAYDSGTDEEYTAGFFDVYPEVMRNTVIWPTPGNHEFYSSDSPTESGPYYDSFSMPILGEAGGVASLTEAYYSFDYGNIHFVSLDSHDTDRSAPANPETNICPPGEGGAMYQWLCADLAATDRDFVIAFWHHPPYTRGSHNSDSCSDSGGRMCDMREHFLPVLEYYGVDLQLTGHSHSYERSMLIDGHYGLSSECAGGECLIDGGDGDPSGDGAYQKATLGMAPGEGAVYAVVGSSSKISGGSLNHPIMEISLNELGSLVVDVDGHQLDATFIDDASTVRDRFRIVKGPACGDGIDNDGDGLADYPDDPGCDDATDVSERAVSLVCDDGVDNDSDGVADYPLDPGCFAPQGNLEGTRCDNDLDDDGDGDGDGKIDWDGGLGGGLPDPECTIPLRNSEKARICGLGFEVALLLTPLQFLWRQRRRRS